MMKISNEIVAFKDHLKIFCNSNIRSTNSGHEYKTNSVYKQQKYNKYEAFFSTFHGESWVLIFDIS